MATKLKACRNCRYLVELNAEKCPVCGGDVFTKLWDGYVVVIDPGNSEVAKKLDIKIPGTYAIRIAR